MNNNSEHPSQNTEFSKLDSYALSQYITPERVNATSTEIIGILGIRFDDTDWEITQQEIERVIEEEIDRYVVYRYVEILFLSKHINITIEWWEYWTAKLKFAGKEVEFEFLTDEDIYKKRSEEIANKEYNGDDVFLAYMRQETINMLRKWIESVISKTHKWIKPVNHYIQDSIRLIPNVSSKITILFSSPEYLNSFATQLIESWFEIDLKKWMKQKWHKKSPKK